MHPGSDWTARLAAQFNAPMDVYALAPTPAPAASPQDFSYLLLPRHGLRPLGFSGRLLARVEAAPPDLPVASRVALHEAEGGGFVCAIRHRLCPPLPPEERCYASFAADAAAVLGFLHAHDPLRDLPAGALLPEGGEQDCAEVLAAAAALAPRLRAIWRELLATSFGPWSAPQADLPD